MTHNSTYAHGIPNQSQPEFITAPIRLFSSTGAHFPTNVYIEGNKNPCDKPHTTRQAHTNCQPPW